MGYAIEMSHKIDKCNMVTNIEFIGNYIYNNAFNSESYYSINEQNILVRLPIFFVARKYLFINLSTGD